MFTKKALVSALFAAGAIATPLTSQAQIEVYLNTAPPAVRYEAVPAPRDGYVWSSGHWQYNNNQYVWTNGEWHAAQRGYVYRQPGWHENNGRWNYQASRWDRDGDGVPNGRDSRPDNPRRN